MESTGDISLPDKEQRKQQQKEAYEEARHTLLHNALDQNALARYNTILLTKPEYKQRLDPILLRAAQSGRQINDENLKQLLEQFSQGSKASSAKVNFQRRRIDSDDSDDD